MGLKTWLRRFFYSDDPVVKVAAGFSEPEAEMWRELLRNNGIPAMSKNMTGWAYNWGAQSLPFERNYDLFVKQSDVERAREVLEEVLEPAQLEEEEEEA